MAHVREQIRAACVTALKAANTLAAQEVYESQVYPLEEAKLPAITVKTMSERSEPLSMGGPIERELDLVVTGFAQAEERELANLLDDMAAEIEVTLGENTFGGIAKRINLTETSVEASGDGSQPTGAIALTFEVLYVTDDNDGETAL